MVSCIINGVGIGLQTTKSSPIAAKSFCIRPLAQLMIYTIKRAVEPKSR